MEFPPGVRFLARNLLTPAISVFIARGAANAALGLSVSIWTVFGVSVGGVIALSVISAAVTAVYQRFHARSMGARLAPSVKGRWPGNVDVLRRLLEIYQTGYLGRLICGSATARD